LFLSEASAFAGRKVSLSSDSRDGILWQKGIPEITLSCLGSRLAIDVVRPGVVAIVLGLRANRKEPNYFLFADNPPGAVDKHYTV
jgi:hypothetical protein